MFGWIGAIIGYVITRNFFGGLMGYVIGSLFQPKPRASGNPMQYFGATQIGRAHV